MSRSLPAGVLPSQITRLDEIQNALSLLMRELYEQRDDPAPTHADCYAWADGISWLAQSIGRVRDTLKGPQA